MKIVKLDELNEDLILLIDNNFTVGKVAFRLVRRAKSLEFPEGNCKMVWNRLVNKHAPHITFSLLKLKSEFNNGELDSIKKDPDEWISYLVRL